MTSHLLRENAVPDTSRWRMGCYGRLPSSPLSFRYLLTRS
jgi:hypothetical protein